MAYRTVHERFWRDPKVTKLSPKNKLLFLYLITSADAHYSGIYYCPLQMIKLETGLSDKEVIEGIDTLSKGYMIEYDMGTNEVFVLNMAKFQVVSKQQIKGVANHFSNAVQSKVLIRKFLDRYDTLSIPYEYTIPYPIDTTETETETERKEKDNKKKVEQKKSFGIEGTVKLTQDEYGRLVKDFGQKAVDEKIFALEGWLNKGNKSKSDNLTIRNWFRRDTDKPKQMKEVWNNETGKVELREVI
jgi:hypothetical protein